MLQNETLSNTSETLGNTSETPTLQLPFKFATEIDYPASLREVLGAMELDLGHKFNESTVKARWMPDKMLPTLEGVKHPAIKDDQGKFTREGHIWLHDYLFFCVVSVGTNTAISSTQYREHLIERYGETVDPLATLKAQTDQVIQTSIVFKSEAQKIREELAEMDRNDLELDQALQDSRDLEALRAQRAQRAKSMEIKAKALAQIQMDRDEQVQIQALLGK
jgi:hypothetical protein